MLSGVNIRDFKFFMQAEGWQ